eukprot:scaffold3181_cov389-Prasinococcus_capsulatus_cf.AAC.8
MGPCGRTSRSTNVDARESTARGGHCKSRAIETRSPSRATNVPAKLARLPRIAHSPLRWTLLIGSPADSLVPQHQRLPRSQGALAASSRYQASAAARYFGNQYSTTEGAAGAAHTLLQSPPYLRKALVTGKPTRRAGAASATARLEGRTSGAGRLRLIWVVPHIGIRTASLGRGGAGCVCCSARLAPDSLSEPIREDSGHPAQAKVGWLLHARLNV